jgi:hypothetical protein
VRAVDILTGTDIMRKLLISTISLLIVSFTASAQTSVIIEGPPRQTVNWMCDVLQKASQQRTLKDVEKQYLQKCVTEREQEAANTRRF